MKSEYIILFEQIISNIRINKKLSEAWNIVNNTIFFKYKTIQFNIINTYFNESSGIFKLTIKLENIKELELNKDNEIDEIYRNKLFNEICKIYNDILKQNCRINNLKYEKHKYLQFILTNEIKNV